MRLRRLFGPIGLGVLMVLMGGMQFGCQPADTPTDAPTLPEEGASGSALPGSGDPAGDVAGDEHGEGSGTKSESESAAGNGATGGAKTAEGAEVASGPETETEGKTAGAAKSGQGNATEVTVDVPLGLPPVPIPDDNPMTAEKIALGKKLYFDKRLSKDGTVSCATCHDPRMAWTEHRPTSKGVEGQVGDKNSPTIINSAYAPEQFWDGRAASLEEQALGPMENPIEMGHELDALINDLARVEEYEESFQEVFGTTVTREGMAKAIAAYERTVLSGNSPYDQYKEGDENALTEAQKRGLKLFEDVGCATCHAPPVFSNHGYYNAGIGMDKDPPDAGRQNVTGEDRDLGKFRVPMLREVVDTHPYYHDGSVETLEEAVEIMATGGKKNDNLSMIFTGIASQEISDQDQKDLVEFLKALSGDYPIPDEEA
ncbi:MAG: cytochrome-c peroxidase [Planctomycetota bacterium]